MLRLLLLVGIFGLCFSQLFEEGGQEVNEYLEIEGKENEEQREKEQEKKEEREKEEEEEKEKELQRLEIREHLAEQREEREERREEREKEKEEKEAREKEKEEWAQWRRQERLGEEEVGEVEAEEEKKESIEDNPILDPKGKATKKKGDIDLVRFLHIPKSGTSFGATLKNWGCKSHEVPKQFEVHPIPPIKHQQLRSQQQQRRQLQQQRPRAQPQPQQKQLGDCLRIVGPGTHKPYSPENASTTFWVTMVRDPADRTISAFEYGRHVFGAIEEDRQKKNSAQGVDGFAALDFVEGCATKMMVEQHCGSRPWPDTSAMLDKAISVLTNDLDFVGITSRWRESICLFHAMHGEGFFSVSECGAMFELFNMRPGHYNHDLLTKWRPKIMTILENHNDPDIILHQHAVKRFEADYERYRPEVEQCLADVERCMGNNENI